MAEYTDAQKKALQEYEDLSHRWHMANMELVIQKRFTEEELAEMEGTPYAYPHNFQSLEDLRLQFNQKRKEVIDLNINIL
jgi:hypothetical protein